MFDGAESADSVKGRVRQTELHVVGMSREQAAEGVTVSVEKMKEVKWHVWLCVIYERDEKRQRSRG